MMMFAKKKNQIDLFPTSLISLIITIISPKYEWAKSMSRSWQCMGRLLKPPVNKSRYERSLMSW